MVYVASENGASAGLGVMIAWPATVAALALISLPIVGGYMLFRGLSIDEGDPESAAGDSESRDAEPADQDEMEGEVEEEFDGEGSEEDPEPEANAEGDDGDEAAEAEKAPAS